MRDLLTMYGQGTEREMFDLPDDLQAVKECNHSEVSSIPERPQCQGDRDSKEDEREEESMTCHPLCQSCINACKQMPSSPMSGCNDFQEDSPPALINKETNTMSKKNRAFDLELMMRALAISQERFENDMANMRDYVEELEARVMELEEKVGNGGIHQHIIFNGQVVDPDEAVLFFHRRAQELIKEGVIS